MSTVLISAYKTTRDAANVLRLWEGSVVPREGEFLEFGDNLYAITRVVWLDNGNVDLECRHEKGPLTTEEESIARFIRWRADLSDRWGGDLICLVSNLHREEDPRMPPEHRDAFELLKSKTYEERERLIKAALPDDWARAEQERDEY